MSPNFNLHFMKFSQDTCQYVNHLFESGGAQETNLVLVWQRWPLSLQPPDIARYTAIK